jgi:hypothetical protein
LGTPLLSFREEGAEIPGRLKGCQDAVVCDFVFIPHLPPSFPASKLFEDKNFHVPLLIVLDSYMRVASVQQVSGPSHLFLKTVL